MLMITMTMINFENVVVLLVVLGILKMLKSIFPKGVST